MADKFYRGTFTGLLISVILLLFLLSSAFAAFPYSESFENGMGIWINGAGGDFNWTIHSGSTGSLGTGPSGAHDGAYYIYTEASSPNYPAKTANIEALFNISSLSNPVMQFFYHMYGAAMGTLYVDIYDGVWNNSVWSISGEQSEVTWTKASIDLSAFTGTDSVIVRFRGITGSSYTSDMAIDKITIIDCSSTEICDGFDNNCDGNIDEGFDIDNDNFTTCDGDCDDIDPAINPDAVETWYDNIDQNCDGWNDYDRDMDGYVDAEWNMMAGGTSAGTDDCDDNEVSVNPGEAEICDGLDNNCNDITDEGFDEDSDSYTTCNGDCDDNNAAINPGETEVLYNDADDDCNSDTRDYRWHRETLDNVGASPNDYTSTAVDASDKVHISYHDNINNELKYVTNVSGSWVSQTIDSTGYAGGQNAISVDTSGNVHIAYYSTDTALTYATNMSGTWTTEATGESCYYISLDTDTQSNAHISCRRNSNVAYISNSSGAWITTAVTGTGNVEYSTNIAVDSEGKVYISYFEFDAGRDMYGNLVNGIKLATNESGSWRYSILGLNSCSKSSIALDSFNTSHISYCTEPGYDLIYDSLPGIMVTIDSSDSVTHNAIAVDLADNVHIGYFNITHGDLKYASNRSGQWMNEIVDETGTVGSYVSIASDSTGHVHMAYLDYTNGTLKYASNNPAYYDPDDKDGDGHDFTTDCDDNDPAVNPGAAEIAGNCKDDDCNSGTSDVEINGDWRIECIDRDGNTGISNDVAADASGYIHISYFDTTGGRLMYATNITGIWTSYAVDENGGEYSSIAADSTGDVHISYIRGNNLYHATNASGSWVSEQVKFGIQPSDTSIVLDSIDNIYIGFMIGDMECYGYQCEYQYFYDRPAYVTNATGSWTTTEVDWDTVATARGIDLQVDPDGYIHMSYADVNEYNYSVVGVKYANNATGSWTAYALPPFADPLGTSISMDSSGNVHIMHDNMSDNYLYHATNETGTWVIERVDSYEGNSPSIAADSSNSLHAAFCDNTGLGYTTNASGEWMREIVDGSVNGSDNALIADSLDILHISYYDSINGNLKYANNTTGRDIDNDSDGYTENQGDCNDRSPAVFPGQIEIPYNGKNDDCNTATPDDDLDSDGFKLDSDCDDNNPGINPDTTEIWYDDIDQNCDGWNDYDLDMDGFVNIEWNDKAGGTSPGINDCDDNDSALSPATYWYSDSDGDGFGNPAVSLQQCMQPVDHVQNNNDCNDSDPHIQNGALPARVMGMTTNYYTLLQDAYDMAADGETIQSREVSFSGGLIININKVITIEGGYDCGYRDLTGATAISGGLTISNGTVTLENVVVE